MNKIHTMIVLKNGVVILQKTTRDLEKLKEEFPQNLKPYFSDAVYYGKERAFIENDVFMICYAYWFE